MNTPDPHSGNFPIADRASSSDLPPELIADIEELIAEHGVRGFVHGCSHTRAGEYLGPSSSERALMLLLRAIAYAPHPQLEAEIIALAVGALLNDEDSQTMVAKRHGVSRAAISKRVVAYADQLGLPPSQFMKSAAARKTYALTNQPRTA